MAKNGYSLGGGGYKIAKHWGKSKETSNKKFTKWQKFGGNTIFHRVQFVGWLDGWMVKIFSSTLRIEVDPIPELREGKPRSARKNPTDFKDLKQLEKSKDLNKLEDLKNLNDLKDLPKDWLTWKPLC